MYIENVAQHPETSFLKRNSLFQDSSVSAPQLGSMTGSPSASAQSLVFCILHGYDVWPFDAALIVSSKENVMPLKPNAGLNNCRV